MNKIVTRIMLSAGLFCVAQNTISRGEQNGPVYRVIAAKGISIRSMQASEVQFVARTCGVGSYWLKMVRIGPNPGSWYIQIFRDTSLSRESQPFRHILIDRELQDCKNATSDLEIVRLFLEKYQARFGKSSINNGILERSIVAILYNNNGRLLDAAWAKMEDKDLDSRWSTGAELRNDLRKVCSAPTLVSSDTGECTWIGRFIYGKGGVDQVKVTFPTGGDLREISVDRSEVLPAGHFPAQILVGEMVDHWQIGPEKREKP